MAKFNSIPLSSAFHTTTFNEGILNLNFHQARSWEEATQKAVEWVTRHIKGRPVYLTDHAELMDGIGDVHQLWPSADRPTDFTTDLVNTYRNIFDRPRNPDNEDADVLDNGDEYAVILVQRVVDLRLVIRSSKEIRPAVFVTWGDVYHGNHNRFMSRWSLIVHDDSCCTIARNISGQSGITLIP